MFSYISSFLLWGFPGRSFGFSVVRAAFGIERPELFKCLTEKYETCRTYFQETKCRKPHGGGCDCAGGVVSAHRLTLDGDRSCSRVPAGRASRSVAAPADRGSPSDPSPAPCR